MSADKYPSIFSRQMEAIVYIEVLLLDLTASGNELHRTGAAWVKALPQNVGQLTGM